jgi:hypothetical protein
MTKVATIVGLAGGSALLLIWGGEAPPWLLKLEVVVVALTALGWGYTAFSPSFPWLREDAVRGVAMVYAGVACMFIPLNFIASAFLLGCGIRLIMKSAVHVSARVMNISINRSSGDIVLRESGKVATRETR